MIADLDRLVRGHEREHRGAPLAAEEAPYRAHALEIALIAAIDNGDEALGQIVDIGDERDARHQPVECRR